MPVEKKKKKRLLSSSPSSSEEEMEGKWPDGPGTGPREKAVTGLKGDIIGYRSSRQPEGCYRTPKLIEPTLDDDQELV